VIRAIELGVATRRLGETVSATALVAWVSVREISRDDRRGAVHQLEDARGCYPWQLSLPEVA